MFTGLIETVGVIRETRTTGGALVLGIVPDMREYDVAPGDSVSINGVCLTLERSAGEILFFRAVAETVNRSNLKQLRSGSAVNMERSLRPQDRMGGHFVLGHIDGIGTILRDRRVGDSVVRTITIPDELTIYMAQKGSVALDGISLTIAACSDGSIDISIIPYSLDHTTMARHSPGDTINIECDVLARYIIHHARHADTSSAATRGATADASLAATLERAGF